MEVEEEGEEEKENGEEGAPMVAEEWVVDSEKNYMLTELWFGEIDQYGHEARKPTQSSTRSATQTKQ